MKKFAAFGVIALFGLAAGCTPESQTTTTVETVRTVSNPPTSVVKTVTTKTQKTKYVYAPDAIANYLDICTKGGGTRAFCSCFITKAQDVYPLEQLISVTQSTNMGNGTPENIKKIQIACGANPATVERVAETTVQEVTETTPNTLQVGIGTLPTVAPVAQSTPAAITGRKFLEDYLKGITTPGYDGKSRFCASSQNSASSLLPPTSYTILDAGTEADNIASYRVRADLSKKGGASIIATWNFYLKKEASVLEKMMADKGDTSGANSTKQSSGGWCIDLINVSAG